MGLVETSPLVAFGDVLFRMANGDAALAGLARAAGATVAVVSSAPRGVRLPKPYVVIGERTLQGSGFAMGVDGGEGDVLVEVWSDFNGPEEVQDIQARLRVLFMRDPAGEVQRQLQLAQVAMIADSIYCPEEKVYPDFDPDMPTLSLFHGVQRWHADLEETA